MHGRVKGINRLVVLAEAFIGWGLKLQSRLEEC